MEVTTVRFSRLPQFLPVATLALAMPLVTACAPACNAVDSWTWGTCFSDMHGSDSSEVNSEIDNAPAAAQADTVERARPLVRALLFEDNLPGLSLAVSVAGEIVWAEGFGWANIEERQPVTPQTRFRIGGTAKPMTATAVGLLVERGQLDIGLSARSYVPSFPEKAWPITTRQLMGHVAGIRHHDEDDEMLYRRTSCSGPLDALGIYADDSLRFEPGMAFEYSSYGWMLVGAVVEAAAGEPFLDFMQREVFDPIGMRDTVLDDPARPAAETTAFYWPFASVDTKTGIEYANNPDNSCLQGAAGLLSTPSDVVRFGAAMLDGRLIAAETLDMLSTPVVLDSGESTGHSLGWSVRQIPTGPASAETTVFGHDAISAGGTTSFVTVPEYGVVIAVTANVSHARNLSSLTAQLVDLFVESSSPNPDGR